MPAVAATLMTFTPWLAMAVALLAGPALLLPTAHAATIEFIAQDDGTTRVDLFGDKPWSETTLVDMFPREAMAWSNQQWPVIQDIDSGARTTIGLLRLYPGQRLTGRTHTKPGKSSAPSQGYYPYQVPADAGTFSADGRYRLSSFREHMIVASRGGVIAALEATDLPSARFLRIVHDDGSVGSYLGLAPYPASQPGVHVDAGQPLGVNLSNLEFQFSVEIPTTRFVPGDQYTVQPIAKWVREDGQRAAPQPPSAAMQGNADSLARLGRLPDAREGPAASIPIPPWAKRLLVIVLVTSLLWFLWTLRAPRRTRSERLREGETSYRRSAYQPGRANEPHLDAYARLLRAVHGDVSRAEALMNYEIKRGSKRSRAALDALDRLIRDRGY